MGSWKELLRANTETLICFPRSCHPNDATSLCRELGGCIEQVARWMSANRLQLNAAKTEEFLWPVPPRRRHQLPPDHLVVGPVQVAPVALVSTSTVTWRWRRTWHGLWAQLLWHFSTDSQHLSIATALNVDDAHLQFHYVEAWLLH